MNASELSRPLKPRALPAGPVVIDASESEAAALAARFGVTAIRDLHAEADLEPKDGGIEARGKLSATIEQPCAVTGEDLSYRVAERFEMRFVPAGNAPAFAPDEEVELAANDLDEIEYEGDSFDIGEAIAQTLALAIDPYREGPGADAARKAAGIVSDEDAGRGGPLAEALAALKGAAS